VNDPVNSPRGAASGRFGFLKVNWLVNEFRDASGLSEASRRRLW